jgi:glycosyltransferase involved in cell wall biosynthesis
MGLVSMKILQVCQDWYGETGGISVHVKNISERLARKHDVTVYATNYGLRLPRFELKNGVRVERFKCYAPSNAYFFSLEMLLRMREAEFDVVHAHGYHGFPMHFAALAKCDKFVVTTHFHGVGHSNFRNCLIKLFKPLGKRTLTRADEIIAVSEYEKALLCRQFKLVEDKIAVVPNGVDFRDFSGLRRRSHSFKSILYVGYLLDYKGAHYLVEVLPKLEDDVVLEIVGTGPLKPYLERRAKELKVYDRVRFYENLSRRELLQKYFDADVFVLLSRFEAYSLVVAEALTAGTPCIVANTSALSEWVDNESCFGVDFPISLNGLARLINSVLDNGADKRAIKKWRGTKILDWNDVVEQLESGYYNEIT